ncbi:MAG: hypothetical protein HYU04_01220 [Candidatus Wildermuthbacteria bacterium]|nr:hypothetical protein [Candidatus Wildermuthbacteria bacterium]
MLEMRAEVLIHCSPGVIWEYMNNIEGWWTLSNADHVSLEFGSSEHHLQEGMQATLQEQFGGIRGESKGVIARVIPVREVMWQADKAVYSYLLFNIPVKQTVVWNVEERGGEAVLSMKVLLVFSKTIWGKVSEWYFVHILWGKQLIARHCLKELLYIKKAVENF